MPKHEPTGGPMNRAVELLVVAGLGWAALGAAAPGAEVREGAQAPARAGAQAPAPMRLRRRMRAGADSTRAPRRRRRTAQAQLVSAPVTSGADAHGVLLTLGAPQEVLRNNQFGMNVPDMHTSVVQGLPFCPQGGAYCLYVTGVIGGVQGRGSTALLTTTDFEHGSAYAVPPGVAQPVFVAPCRGMQASLDCRLQFDAGYRGANLVFQNGGDWFMIYHGETRTFTDVGGAAKTFARIPAYAEVGLARSTDGLHWDHGTPIITGADPKPTLTQVKGPKGLYGTPEPGAIVDHGFVYVFFSYNPSPGSPDAGQHGGIQVARAPLQSLGSSYPGSWVKYDGGSWNQPGRGGRSSDVVPPPSGCSKAGQPFVAYSTYARKYIMGFMCSLGWYYSSASDLNAEDWSPPKQFYKAPVPEFTPGQPVDENFVFVSSGGGSSIGRTGDVLYAHGTDWGAHPSDRSLWYRGFTISLVSPPPLGCPPAPPGKPVQCK